MLMNGRYGALDLRSGESSEGDVPEDSCRDAQSYLSFVRSMAEERSDDAVAVASGLLTCSLLPASCMGFVVSSEGDPEGKGICPLTGYIGTELKLSGFDFVVISGKAEQPGYVWIRDGIVEFVPSPFLSGMDSWGRTDRIRADQGDRKIQVISIGPWGDAAMPSSQLIANYWGGEDKMGFAAAFGRKSLSAVAVRGMGELELADPDEHFDRSIELRGKHMSALGSSNGLSSYCEEAGAQGFSELFHRKVSCYGCPYPCRSYFKVYEDPSVMELKNPEPGYLAYDVSGFRAFASLGMSHKDVIISLISCARNGAEPASVARAVDAEGKPASLDSVNAVLSAKSAEESPRSDGGWISDALADASDYLACLTLGLCPRYWSKAGFDADAISYAAEPAVGQAMKIR